MRWPMTRRERGVLQPSIRDLRNCCFRVFGVWCGIIQRPLHTSRRSQEVIKFISNCGDDNLMFLLHPPRLKKALHFLDTDQSGEIDKEEWDCLLYTSPSPRD